MSYKYHIKFGGTCKVWSEGIRKELGHLIHEYNGTAGKYTMFYLSNEEIVNIPSDRVVTYIRIVVDYRPPKI